MKKILVTLLAFVSLSAFAEQAQDGNRLLEFIKNKDMFSLGYIRGVADSTYICTSGGVTNGQMESVVQKYLEDNPATRNEYQGVLVVKALQKAWPCKKIAPKG